MFLLLEYCQCFFVTLYSGVKKGGARLVILRKKQDMLWKIKQILMKTTQKKHTKI